MNTTETFFNLHQRAEPFLLGNVWDAGSAKVFERSGYKAIATSSAAVAHSLGYEDGEQLPFDTLFQLVKRIMSQVTIPVSVDIEGGYSRSLSGILGNIEKLYQLGVAGINIEDTVVSDKRSLRPAADFQKALSSITDHLSRNNIKLFVNARTDAFLLGLSSPLAETLARVKAYENAGVSGIFVPCIMNTDDIRKVVQATSLPVNVLNLPGLPDYNTLTQCGVKRISMGNFAHDLLMATLDKKVRAINETRSLQSLFE